jgi:C4-dicarboxylate-binding protein DctP
VAAVEDVIPFRVKDAFIRVTNIKSGFAASWLKKYSNEEGVEVMKKRFMVCLFFCLALFLAVTVAHGEASAADKVFELKLSHSMAATSYSQKAYQYFADMCEKESGGTIKITIFPAGTLLAGQDIFDGILNRNADIGEFQASYLTSVMRELLVLEIPGIYSGSRYPELHKATKGILNEIFAKYDLKYVAPIPHDVLVFVGDSVVKDPTKDLPGKKIRVAGKWSGEAVLKWGGSPMTIPIGDVPTALERHTVNLVNTSWIATGGFKLYEMGPHVTMTDMQEIFPGLILNMDVWNGFSDAQKTAFDRAAELFATEGNKLLLDEKAKFIAACKAANVEIYTANAEENAYYRKVANELVEQVKPQVGELGLKLIDTFRIPALQD